MAVIGIDLGTTYCAASRYIDEDDTEFFDFGGKTTMPSVISVRNNGNIIVGWAAKNNQAKAPQNTVIEVKREMGKDVKIKLGQKEFNPQDLSAMILKKIKASVEEQLGEEVTGAVITCPAYFKDPARAATKEAGILAGLNVLKVVNEPTAAAFAYGVEKGVNDEKNIFLVYDLGGGTFDVTVIEMLAGSLDVIGTGGDPELGGGNFDDRIVNWMLDQLEKIPGYSSTLSDEKRTALKLKLKSYAEVAKKELCGPPLKKEYQFQIPKIDKLEGKPVAFNEILTMETFEFLIKDLMDNSMKWIDVAMEKPHENKGYNEDDITEILLVGGSTRVPLVRKALAERFPNTPLRGVESGINPDEIVAMGAGMIAAESDEDCIDAPPIIMTDVTGHTLSVEMVDNNNKPFLQPLIPKETPIPASSEHHGSSYPNADRVKIKVFEGEGKEPNDPNVTMIGEFFIMIDPIPEPTPVKISLNLDENTILVAKAINEITLKEEKCTINYESTTKMSEEELERKKSSLEADMKKGIGTNINPLEEERSMESRKKEIQKPQNNTSNDDPRSKMNPIIRDLYNKAINNFAKIPADKQAMVITIVSEIENCARAGDQVKLMSFHGPLTEILKDIQ